MARSPRPPRTWLTIHEASDLVGVSSATLRRWTEAGDVEAFVTPGGHRRFARSSIVGLLPSGVKRRRRLHALASVGGGVSPRDQDLPRILRRALVDVRDRLSGLTIRMSRAIYSVGSIRRLGIAPRC